MAGWKFTGNNGTFILENPEKNSYLYFPLANESGMMASITPLLHGDSKTGQNSFLLAPVSAEDLHNTRSGRNFWVYIEGYGPWSVTGNSARQLAQRFTEDGEERVLLEAGFLWHKITREHRRLKIKAEITNFVPANKDRVELMKVTVTNQGDKPLVITPTAAIPIYGRSADNLRDHRHVTSLLHRIKTNSYGVEVKPTLSFDERGHRLNKITYGVMGAGANGEPPAGFFPVLQDFIGEGGTLDWPEKVVQNQSDYVPAGFSYQGYESIGAIRFRKGTIEPRQSVSYILVMVIDETGEKMETYAEKYCSAGKFAQYFAGNTRYWEAKLGRLAFYTGDRDFDQWMKWVTLQPVLRRIFGCSFLPYHDYGRGGRGWRDLWQDCLALLLMADDHVRYLLYNNFAGVRIDGSNATIIGSQPGEFLADRNNIPRVWMDHGAWPLLTTRLYIDITGDLGFLLEEQTYYKDHLVSFSRAVDEKWQPEQGNKLLTENRDVYRGTILEHLLVENLTAFFNVGDHNNIRLENADWNDGLDMASDRGESVAFTAFYAGNLFELTRLLKALQKSGVREVELLQETTLLLDTLNTKIDYNSVKAKNELLYKYFALCRHRVSGRKVKIAADDLIRDLEAKADWFFAHLREEEWLANQEGYEWFNGYYDNHGRRVEGDHPGGVRMTLTGQVFEIMSGVAAPAQIKKIISAADRYLKDEKVGGYRLNTDFNEVKLDLGRCFGFAFGHKENGAIFSHMAVMYANALYKRGFVHEGYTVWKLIYNHCRAFETARIYPGIPEYINDRGRGMYPYLTGSASWLLLTMVTEVYGVKGLLGDLKIEPKLKKEQFDEEGRSRIKLWFANKHLEIEYINSRFLDYGEYAIKKVTVNGGLFKGEIRPDSVLIPRKEIADLAAGVNKISVKLE